MFELEAVCRKLLSPAESSIEVAKRFPGGIRMQDSLARKIISEFSYDHVDKHMRYLVDEVGERLSGTPELKKAAEYIHNVLISQGLNSEIDEFPMYHSFPGEASLTITVPHQEEIPTRPVCHIRSTGSEGVQGELLYLGVGGKNDYKSQNAAGKIVLVDMNWAPARPEKALIAWQQEAAALIIMNWGLPDPANPVIQMGAVKSQWGNPTPESFADIPDIPVITISRYHGEYLKELCRQGPVHVVLTAEATREWVTAKQPTAFLPAGIETDECIIFGSHLDAWGKSAICNATGNALLMELSRLFFKYRKELKRNIWFVFWDGHEIAEGAGSAYFADKHWQLLTRFGVAYVNADNLAIGGTTEPTIEGNSDLKAYTQNLLETVWGEKGHWIDAYKGGGDSSFFGLGVPYLSFATEYTEEELEKLNYAVYGPWLHTAHDTVDKVDFNIYHRTMIYFTHLVTSLATLDQLPYSLPDFVKEIRSGLQKLTDQYPQLLPLPEAGAKDALQALDEKLNTLQTNGWQGMTPGDINRLQMRILRHLYPVFRSYSGRYGQDACGSGLTEKPAPRLAYALDRASAHPLKSHDFYLWQTEVIRQKNRVFDAIDQALFIIEKL
jgi:hypothetical protein